MELREAHVLVVGATGGLGGAVARALAAAGARLSLSGRDPAALAALAADLGPVVLGTTVADLVQVDAPARIVAAARELRRGRIRVLDVRPGHTGTGLAGHPIAGTAPSLGEGMTPDHVAARIVRAMAADEADLPSDAF